jgi:ABC-type cobalamin/Fe3+-siderophores transport system ATPase subunit
MESESEMDKKYFNVYFETADNSISELTFPLIRIAKKPGDDRKKTDELAYRFEVFRQQEELIYHSEFSLAIFDEGESNYLPGRNEPINAGKSMFFSMLDDSESYRQIVKQLGVEQANNVLISINDVVASREVSPQPKWLQEVAQHNSFQVGFMQHYSKFFAYHNAGSILRGLKEETLFGISKELKLEFELASFESKFEVGFTFDPDSYIPKRICILIGENGLGKSQSLSNIARSLMYDKGEFTEMDGSRPIVNRLLAIASPGETVNTFPAERKSSRIDYRRLLTSRTRNQRTSHGFGEICVQLFRSKENDGGIKGEMRWDIFLKFLGKFDNPFEICLQVKSDSKDEVVSGTKEYWPIMGLGMNTGDHQLKILAKLSNNLQPVRYLNGVASPLSSGQVTLLKFAAIACLHIENGSLVLLDEPETHLHPNYVSLFVELLDGLLKESGSLAIIATHSPYLVREVPKSQVKVFKRTELRHVSITEPRLKTFGADIDSISHFIFEDSIMNRLGEKLIEQLAETKGTENYDRILEELQEELPVEMMMYLSRRLEE